MVLSFFINGCYSFRIASHYNDLYRSRKKISTVLASRDTDTATKQKLETFNKILLYAKKELLNVEGAYQYIIFNEGTSVSYVMQVVEADELKQVTWWYPFIGSVPYKGYFTKLEAEQEASIWQKKKYDTYLGSVSAFSSLGWFEDPVFSSMLNRSEFALAELIFHELVHRTTWIAGSVEFNEQFASYVAEKLTIHYLLSEKKEAMLNAYKKIKSDKQLFYKWLDGLKMELTHFYSAAKNQSLDEKMAGKLKIFKRYLSQLRPSFEKVDYIGSEASWNNAKVLSFSLYSPNYKLFDKAYTCYKDSKLGEFVLAVDKCLKGNKDYVQGLELLCKKKCQ